MKPLRFVCLAAALWSGVALAQPQLPEGLGGSGTTSEPALPAGIAGDKPWPEEEGWDLDGGQSDGDRLPVTGFWELRLGYRTSPVDNQRRGSLAEMRLALEKDVHWQQGSAKVAGDLIYDAIEDSHHLDLETGLGWLDLREAWLQQRFGEAIDVKLGRQVMTWGVGDLVFINDLFPKDWNSFLAGREEQYLKAPSDALRLGWYTDVVNINLVYTPRFDADRYIDGRRLSYFSPLRGQVVGRNGILAANPPDSAAADDEWALRLYRRLGSYEVALYGYDGFWKSPGGFDPSSGLAVFPRLSVYGASARGPVGPGILSLEAGYYHSREDADGSDPFVNNDEIRALAGYEWEVATDTTLGFQYYVEMLRDHGRYRATLPPGLPVRDEIRQLLTARLTRLAMNQNLTLSLFAFYSPTDQDAYLRPKVSYKISDAWLIEGGLNLFRGRSEHSFFGQFEDNSNVYGAVRYSF